MYLLFNDHLFHAQVDLLQIRREYKKKYGELLIESLETRCRSPIKKALIQMVLVHGSPKEDTKEAEKVGVLRFCHQKYFDSKVLKGSIFCE